MMKPKEGYIAALTHNALDVHRRVHAVLKCGAKKSYQS